MAKFNLSKFWDIATPLIGAGATTVGMDAIANPDKEFFNADHWDKRRATVAVINSLLGAGGGALSRWGAVNLPKGTTGAASAIGTGAALIGMAPAKDFLINAQHLPNKVDEVLDATNTAIKNQPTQQNELKDLLGKHTKTIGLVGAGALGLGGAALIAKMLKKDKQEAPEMGRIRYRIPGKNGDPSTEAIVELPLSTDKLSPSMLENIDTNIKRQAVKNIKANMRKRDPETGKLITMDEFERKYGRGLMLKSSSAEVEVGQTGKPAPFAAHVNTSETPSIVQAFYRVRAGLGFNDHGTTVKSASRAFHEGAGSMATSLATAAGGAYLGNKLYAKNPLLGAIAGGLTGGALPTLIGKLTAAVQEKDRTEKDQEEHDKTTIGAEYLVPGYANYQHERRKDVKKEQMTPQIAGASFAAVGMNPLLPSQGVSLEDAAEADMHKVDKEAEYSSDWGDDDSFDSLSKYASAGGPPAGGPPPQGGPLKDPTGLSVAPATKGADGATTSKQLTAAVNDNDAKPRLTDRQPGKLLAKTKGINNKIKQMA